MIETTIERIQGEDYCLVFTSEKKFINQLMEYSKQFSEVDIRHINEDGSITAHVPYEWFRFIKPPTKRNYTEEQRKAASERMKKVREKKDENQQMANS